MWNASLLDFKLKCFAGVIHLGRKSKFIRFGMMAHVLGDCIIAFYMQPLTPFRGLQARQDVTDFISVNCLMSDESNFHLKI